MSRGAAGHTPRRSVAASKERVRDRTTKRGGGAHRVAEAVGEDVVEHGEEPGQRAGACEAQHARRTRRRAGRPVAVFKLVEWRVDLDRRWQRERLRWRRRCIR